MGFNDFWVNSNGQKEQLNNEKQGVHEKQKDAKLHNIFNAVNGDNIDKEQLQKEIRE